MSHDLERAAERAIERLRSIAGVRREAGDAWIAHAMEEIAESLAQPLGVARHARAREDESSRRPPPSWLRELQEDPHADRS